MNIYPKLILKCTPIARDLCDDRGLCRLSTFLSSTLAHFLICFLLNYPHLTCSLKAIYSHGIPHIFSLCRYVMARRTLFNPFWAARSRGPTTCLSGLWPRLRPMRIVSAPADTLTSPHLQCQ